MNMEAEIIRKWKYQLIFLLLQLMRFSCTKNFDLIKGPPKIINSHLAQQKLVIEGKDVKLTCPVVGNPQPIYEWLKDSVSLSEEGWDRLRTQKNTLKIKRVTSEDSGIYTCKGVNGFGNEQFHIYLRVQAGLGDVHQSSTGEELKVEQVSPVPGTIMVKLTGEEARFRCLVSGKPEPDITWFKNGRILNLSDYPRDSTGYEYPKKNKFSLHLSQLTTWDSGNYSCEVINIHGSKTITFGLNVISSMAEVFPLHLSNQTVVSGDEAVLRCKGSWDSEISPKVKWLRKISTEEVEKYPENLTFAYKGNYYHVLHPSELLVLHNGVFVTKLVIKDTEMKDSGIYVCLATNRFGLNFREASLVVVERDSNLGHMVMIVSLSSLVFLIVVMAVVVTVRKKKAKRLPPLSQVSASVEQAKIQLQSCGRPLLPAPVVSDHCELQRRYAIYPPVTSSHLRQEEKSAFDSNSRLHPSVDEISLASKSNESNPSQRHHLAKHVQPIVVYQDAPISTYISSTPAINRFHIQNFNVV